MLQFSFYFLSFIVVVQNGKIIGAVSHVTLDNPIYGYGMYIEWMLNQVENIR